MNFAPDGLTSTISISAGPVWVRPVKVTETLVISPLRPATSMFVGKGPAGAPVVRPEPEKGSLMFAGFENCAEAQTVVNEKVAE
jgi:hypothetical protein